MGIYEQTMKIVEANNKNESYKMALEYDKAMKGNEIFRQTMDIVRNNGSYSKPVENSGVTAVQQQNINRLQGLVDRSANPQTAASGILNSGNPQSAIADSSLNKGAYAQAASGRNGGGFGALDGRATSYIESLKARGNAKKSAAQNFLEATNPIAQIYRTGQAVEDIANTAINGKPAEPYEVGQYYINKADKARQDFTEQTGNNPLGGIALTVGDMAAAYSTAGALGLGTTPYLAASSGLQTAGEDINSGRGTGASIVHGTLSGGITYLTEGLGAFGQTALGKSVVSKLTSSPVIKKIVEQAPPQIAKLLGSSFAKYLANASEEGFEEAVEYPAQVLLENIMFDDAAPFSFKQWADNIINGFGAGAVYGAANLALSKFNAGSANANVDMRTMADQIAGQAMQGGIGAQLAQNVAENAQNVVPSGQNVVQNTANSQTIGNMENSPAVNGAVVNNPVDAREQAAFDKIAEDVKALQDKRQAAFDKIEEDFKPVQVKGLNSRIRRVLKATESRLGVNIEYDKTLRGDNGYYDPNTRTIHIAADSADPIGVVLTHEITHRMKETSPELYQNFKNTVFGLMQENGSFERVRDTVANTYADPNVIEDEMLAHFTRNIVEDIDSFEQLVGVNRNLAQKLYDYLSEIINKIAWDGDRIQDDLFGDMGYGQLQRTREAWRVMLDKADAAAQGSGETVGKSVSIDNNGKPFVVIDNDILSGVPKKDWVKTVKDTFKRKFPNGIDMGGFTVKQNSDSRSEFTNSDYTQHLRDRKKGLYANKMRMADNLDEIVQNAYDVHNEGLKHTRKDNYKSFNHGKMQIRIGTNDYTVDVVTAINAQNDEVFYDIVGITPTKIGTTPRGVNLISGAAPINSKPQTEPAVNTQYMQNGADNAQTMHSKPLENEIAAMQSLGRKSVNDFTKYDLKATEKYAEKVWSEMGVKSPFFRAWFGDWRAYDKTPVIVANVKGDSRGIVKNNDTGWKINVSSRVFNESKAHRGPLNKPALPYLPYINDIVKKSVLLDSFTVNEPKSPNTMMMHSMYAIADIGNGPEVLKLYVEEINDPNNSDTLKRAYQLQNIEKATGMGVVGSEQAPSLIASIPVAINTVSDLFNAVKQRDANFNPKPVSPKLLNEDGTPKVMYHQTENDFTVFDVGHEGSGSGDSGTPYGVFMKPNSNDIGLRGKKQMPIYGRMANPLEIESRTELETVLRENAQYAGILNEINRVNSEYRVKVKEAVDNLKSYIINWRKENPHRSTQELYQDEEFERVFDEEDRLSDEWTAKIDRLSAQAKAFATEHLKQSGYDGVILKNDDGSFGRKTEANIVLNPNQVKSATDNIGTFSRYNDDIRYSKPLASLKRQFEPHPQPEGVNRDSGESAIKHLGEEGAFNNVKQLLDEARNEQRVRKEADKDSIALIATPEELKQRRKNALDIIEGLSRKVIDSGERIDKIGKAVGDDVLYPMFNNARQARSAAMNDIGVAQTDLMGNRVGKSIADIVSPIKQKGSRYWDAFQLYVYHMHNIDSMTLATRGVNIIYGRMKAIEAANPALAGLDADGVKELRKNPELREACDKWLALERRMKTMRNKPVFGHDMTAEDSRNIVGTLLMAYPEMETEAKEVTQYYQNMMNDNVTAGLISEEERSLLAELYPHYVPVMTNSLPVAGERQSSRAAVEDIHKSRKLNNRQLLPIDEAMARKTLSTIAAQKRNLFGIRLLEHALTERDKIGRDVQSIYDSDMLYDMDAEDLPRLDNKFSVWVDGAAADMAVSPELMEGIRSMIPKPSDGNYAAELCAGAINIFKKSVTSWNPFFGVTNALKDFQDALLYTEQGIGKFVSNYGRAYKEIATNGEYWRLYQGMGGVGNSYFNYGDGVDLPNSRGIKKLGDKLEAINLAIEQAPRLSEFIGVVEKGGRGYENMQKALLAAADITVNFGRNGEVGKNINRYAVPFFNPGIQGANKWFRALCGKESKKAFALLIAKAFAAGMLPVLFNEIMYRDDDEYKILTNSVKDNYYLIKYQNGIWFRIPKGRALMPFANLAQRGYRQLRGDKDAFDGYIESSISAVAPNNPFTENFLTPWFEADLFDPDSPGKTWYGGDIESKAMQSLKPGDRTDEYTSSIANAIGKTLNLSPKKINHIIDAYSGVLGDVILPLTAPAATGAYPLIDRFYTNSTFKNRLSADYYQALDDATREINSTPTPGAYAQKDALNEYSKDISDLNKQIHLLQNSDMPKKEKLSQVKEVRRELNDTYKEALDAAEQARREIEQEFEDIPDKVFQRAVLAYDSAIKDTVMKNGKEQTVPLSLDRNRKKAIDEATPELNYWQRKKIYEILGINKKVW